MPKQEIVAGQLQQPFQRELQHYLEGRMVQLLWAKDSSLWPKELIHSNPALAKMDWVSLPDGMAQFLESVSQFLVSADADGLVDHALLTSESLNLSARAFLDLPAATRRRKVVIFDSTAPETIQNNKQQLDLRQTLFVLSNKAHYGLRDHCLFLYFREKLQALLGNRASRHFLSETEPGTYLATISRGYTFREIRPDVTAIPATYCSLMQFGGVLTATAAAPAEEIIAAVRQIQTSCSSTDSPDANPALQLAAFLTCSALGRRPYLAFLVSPSLIAYARRLAQLVGGSMAQGSAGLIPIIWPLPSPTDGLQRRAMFAVLSYKGDDHAEINKTISELQSNAEPFIHIRIEDPADLLTETFKWEAATILACARLASDPFDIDQSRVPRAFGREILEQLAHGNNPLQRSARITNSFLDLNIESHRGAAKFPAHSRTGPTRELDHRHSPHRGTARKIRRAPQSAEHHSGAAGINGLWALRRGVRRTFLPPFFALWSFDHIYD